ncbi:MAG: kynureninase [Betaproteobacteria bacterium]|nr:kynureninase [Betaproteobacteria bacterium]NBP44683.1 kynureninase [Betaproteobacteria bacterium]
MLSLQDCQALDRADPLRVLKDQFVCPPGVMYLDGNSLGVMPKATPGRIRQVVEQEWGQGLIRSWNSAGWVDWPAQIGDKVARLVGAGPNELVVTDSTSVNLFKVLSAALAMARHDAPQRDQVLSERSNFPTDLYMAQSLCQQHGMRLVLVDDMALAPALSERVAVLMLTHVNYRTGAMHDMAALDAQAKAKGILTVWDLAHSAGAVEVDLRGSGADFAVGCGYKYLNGGPGAPAFVWVNAQHASRFWQPLSGWWGHERPFAFTPGYVPAQGIARYLCGTPPVISLAALDEGVNTVLAAEPLGGMPALRKKSVALCETFIALVEQCCADHGLRLVSPRDAAQRGSQLSWCFDTPAPQALAVSQAYAVVQALMARGVVGDFRAGDGASQPDLMRFGFTPLYIGFETVWQAVMHLKAVLDHREWQRPQFQQVQTVT